MFVLPKINAMESKEFLIQKRFLLQDISTMGTLSVISWIVKDLSYLTILSRQSEKLYLTIESVQDSCAIVLMSNCSGNFSRPCFPLKVNGNRLSPYYMEPKHTGALWVYISTPLPNPSENTGVYVCLVETVH